MACTLLWAPQGMRRLVQAVNRGLLLERRCREPMQADEPAAADRPSDRLPRWH
jgi:hypothetical protein